MSAPLSLGKGFVGKKLVTTMYDSGTNIMVVDQRIVPKSAYTVKYNRCRTFSGRIEAFSQCHLYVKTPHYTGLTDVCSLSKPVDNWSIPGVKNCTN